MCLMVGVYISGCLRVNMKHHSLIFVCKVTYFEFQNGLSLMLIGQRFHVDFQHQKRFPTHSYILCCNHSQAMILFPPTC